MVVHFLGKVKDGLSVEHPEIHAAARQAIDALPEVSLQPVDGEPAWLQDSGFVERVNVLARHLQGAIALAEARSFASSYAIVRTALEHMVIDRLLLLSTRYIHPARSMTQEEFALLETQLDDGELPGDVQAVRRSNRGRMTVERIGQHVKNSEGEVVEQISVYYGILDHFVPIIGPPGIQDRVGADRFVSADEASETAKRHQTMYRHFLAGRR